MNYLLWQSTYTIVTSISPYYYFSKLCMSSLLSKALFPQYNLAAPFTYSQHWKLFHEKYGVIIGEMHKLKQNLNSNGEIWVKNLFCMEYLFTWNNFGCPKVLQSIFWYSWWLMSCYSASLRPIFRPEMLCRKFVCQQMAQTLTPNTLLPHYICGQTYLFYTQHFQVSEYFRSQ